MGVKGLKTFLENNHDILKKRKFRNSKLIIDGSNLYHTLYFKPRLDQKHGGEYDAFETEIRAFFRNLRKCRIQPYVVLDGGDDVSDKKFETLKSRTKDRIKRAEILSKGDRGEVLPTLTKNVFKQVVRNLKVPLIQCVSEADWEVAALANEWKCPVLSNDTDFYIFNIEGGFLPLSHFSWEEVTTSAVSTNCFIKARWYSVSNLCASYKTKNKSLLPIFAAILGNDYTQLDKTWFPNWAEFSRSGGRSEIDGLLRWLSRFPTMTEAIRELRNFNKNSEDSLTVLKELTKSLEEYNLSPSCIAQFFISGEPQGNLPEPLQILPDWFLKAFAGGKLNSILLNALTLHRVILNFSVQDFSRDSNNLMSRSIRQLIYGLMLGLTEGECHEVEEYDRKKVKLITTKVTATLTDLPLETLWETPETQRFQIFSRALKVTQAPDELLVPQNLQLAVYVTIFWLKEAKPEPRSELYWALLIGLVHGELSIDPFTQEDVPKKLMGLRGGRKVAGVDLDLEAAHAFSQWQCVLRDSICLNQLLHNPVPEPQYAWLYSGLFLHRVVRELDKGLTAESLLNKCPEALRLYQKLRAAVERELDKNVVRRMRVEESRKKKAEAQDPTDLSSKMMDNLSCDEDEDEDEDTHRRGKTAVKCDGKIRWRLRTRHEARNRRRDPKSKKYERSCLE
ncbi:protein asteroid homolog 1-like [Hoplias malabaricus]|uniref:protein asteroid homolog 1-like n=1 Tax=Hoplias malabaricus TaxID=27720 RepID=UPI0034636290